MIETQIALSLLGGALGSQIWSWLRPRLGRVCRVSVQPLSLGAYSVEVRRGWTSEKKEFSTLGGAMSAVEEMTASVIAKTGGWGK